MSDILLGVSMLFFLGIGACKILLLVRIFRISGLGWGLAGLFIPFASLVWIGLNWDEAKYILLAGVTCFLVGFTTISVGASLNRAANVVRPAPHRP